MYNQTQKSERQYKKDKEKLENQKVSLELKDEIKQYLGWQALPYLEKAKIRVEWDNYYVKCKNSISAKEFFMGKQALKSGNIALLNKIADKARTRLESKKFMPKPEGIDPWEFSHGIYYKYDNICNQINLINKQLTGVEDVEDIFDKPKKQYKQPYLD